MIGIIDTGVSNLRSLQGAVELIGEPTELISEAGRIEKMSRLIIPGVGNFRHVVSTLRANGVIDEIIKFKFERKPILGICLGMQLLADYGTEGGLTEGLSFIPGHVESLSIGVIDSTTMHVGWNSIEIIQSHPILNDIDNRSDFYFVHSYHFCASRESDKFALTQGQKEFVSVVGFDNVVGVQFHPEKSHRQGGKVLENFCKWNF